MLEFVPLLWPAVCDCAFRIPIWFFILARKCCVLFVELDVGVLRASLATYRQGITGGGPVRITKHDWELVDRSEASGQIANIVDLAIYNFVTPESDRARGRFVTQVMLALNLPGIGKSRMLYELIRQQAAQLLAKFPGRVVAVIDLIFTFNRIIDNDVQIIERGLSITALLGWRALRHYFAWNMGVDAFYEK